MTAMIFLQTALIGWVGFGLMKDRPFGEVFLVAILATMAARFAIARGVPTWTDWQFGDAYDLGVIVFLSLCLVRGAA